VIDVDPLSDQEAKKRSASENLSPNKHRRFVKKKQQSMTPFQPKNENLNRPFGFTQTNFNKDFLVISNSQASSQKPHAARTCSVTDAHV